MMTKLNSILKNRDITLQTKVCLVKTVVFPVVMYGCESWTITKPSAKELMILNWVLEKTPESPLDCKIKSVNAKGNLFIGRTDGEAEASITWPPDEKS